MRVTSLIMLFLIFGVHAFAQDTYVVGNGESLSTIARNHLGTAAAYKEIAELNNIAPPYRIRAGQELILPRREPPAPPVRSLDSGVVATDRPATPRPTAHPQEFILVDASGKVELIRDAVATPLAKSVRIRPGDTLRTGAQSRVLLSGKSGERVVLEENVSFLIRELTSGLADRRIVLRIDEGTVRFFAPKSPFLTRYLLETPTGSVSLRSGECQISVFPPEITAVSFFQGKGVAQLPLGELEIPEGWGIRLKTLERPEVAQPLPRRPGIILETAPRIAILAAATDPGMNVVIDAFSDPDKQIRVGSRRADVDRLGVAVSRFVLPAGKYWFGARAENPDGLVSEYTDVGPVEILDKLP